MKKKEVFAEKCTITLAFLVEQSLEVYNEETSKPIFEVTLVYHTYARSAAYSDKSCDKIKHVIDQNVKLQNS